MADEAKDPIESSSGSLRQARKKTHLPSGEVRGFYWGYQNEPVKSYEESFVTVLGGKYISDLISSKQNPIVIDLMSAPYTVHDLLMPFPTGRGLSVGLPDHNVRDYKKEVQDAYKSQQVTWLPKDITDADTWREIEQWLHGNKAQLIMERGMGGLALLPASKRILGILVNKAWSNVDPNGGVLLFETPRRDKLLEKGVDANAWVDSLRTVVDVKYDPGEPKEEYSDPRFETGKIMITRRPDSPSLLPSI